MMTKAEVDLYPETLLRQFVQDYLVRLGEGWQEAQICADGILYGAMHAHPGQGQGMGKLFRHTKQIQNGGIQVQARMEFLSDRPATALLDAHKGAGYEAGRLAMQTAMQKATSVWIGCVLVRHSNHYGTSGYYARMAALEGMIGIAFTNAGPEMAPWGAKTPVLGTNPWGIGLPRRSAFPIILDMALTMSGQGMIRWAYREGREIPISWAMTRDGQRTTNPAEVLDGIQLPIGEFKGSGLSFMTDAIAGVLSGAKFGMDCYNDLQDLDVGHCLMAFDPQAFMPLAEFEERLAELVHQVKGAAPIQPGSEILLPGELEYRRAMEAHMHGIPLDRETAAGLIEMAEEIGCLHPFKS